MSGTTHLKINVSYDASVNSTKLPGAELAEFKSAVQAAVQFYEDTFSNPITLNIAFGWGEIDGSALDPSALAESEGNYASYTYQRIYNAVEAKDTTSNVQDAAATLLRTKDPTDPTGGSGTFEMASPEAKALGLTPAGGLDGHVGLGSTYSWGWSQNNIGANSFDAVGALEHEISEVMGRVADGGEPDVAGDYTLLDMFRYTAKNGQELDPIGSPAGVLDQPFVHGYNANAFSYFSYNGTTVTLPYATPGEVAGGGDVADWTGDLATPDSYGDGAPGEAGPVSPTDIEEMNVLGYDLAQATAPAPAITVTGGAAGHSPPDVNLAHRTATVHFAFTVAPVSFVLADTSAVGGTLSNLSGSGTAYTATFTAAGNTDIASAKVSVGAGSWTGTDGDPGAGGSSAAFTVDTKTPTVSVKLTGPIGGVVAGTATVSFSFSEAPVAFALADITAAGGMLSGLAGSGTSYSATFTAAARTDITNASVNVLAGSWKEISGNPGAAGSAGFAVDSMAPGGFALVPDFAHLAGLEGAGSSLSAATPIGPLSAVGGAAADSYSFTLGGAAAGSFSATGATLATAGTALTGAANGTLYPLTVTVHDITNGLHSGPRPFDVVVGNAAGDTINLATGVANLGVAPSTPTLVYGLGGNDIIDASGMTALVRIVGGAGADTLTGGSGPSNFLYASASESRPADFDTITNFSVVLDRIDLRGLGSTVLAFQASQLGGGSLIAKDTIAWQQSGANTDVYVNTSGASETTGNANMLIVLKGDLALTGADFMHH